MHIQNNHRTPPKKVKNRVSPAQTLPEGVSGTGPIALTQNPVVNYPTIVDSPRIITTTGTATVNVDASDTLSGVSIYQSSTPVTSVQLPTAPGIYPVSDGGLNAQTYPIKILPPAGLKILGQDYVYITFNGASATFANDGNQIVAT